MNTRLAVHWSVPVLLVVFFALLLILGRSASHRQSPTTQQSSRPGDWSASGPEDSQQQSPASQKLQAYIDPTMHMEFVRIPGGCFAMGNPRWNDADKTLRVTCVDEFWLGKYEVTNRQFRLFQPDHDSGRVLQSDKLHYQSLNGDLQPVVMVSWDKAMEYTAWLSSKGNGKYRLPTEAEWEYAARAGTTTDMYWGDYSDQSCEYANVSDATTKRTFRRDWGYHDCDDGYAVSAPVGSFPPNGFGLHDMLGNASEWVLDICADATTSYPAHSRRNPLYVGPGNTRVRRGGGWSSGWMGISASVRDGRSPTDTFDNLGFRLVRIP